MKINHSKSTSARTVWTDTEQFAVALAYCIMQQHHTLRPYDRINKTAIRRALMGTILEPGPCAARSHGSIDCKFMNLSAVAFLHGDPVVPGYVPANNAQKSLSYWYRAARRIVQQDTERNELTDFELAFSATAGDSPAETPRWPY